MYPWHNHLMKMKVHKLLSYSILVKLQSSGNLKKTLINRVQLQSFSLCSCSFSEKNAGIVSDVSFTGMEQIKTLPKISKRKNKLSKVEEKDLELLDRLKKGDLLYPYENPAEQIKTQMKEDAKVAYQKAFHYVSNIKIRNPKPIYFDKTTDILIIGGGAVGLSIAYFIRNQFPYGPKVTVVDKDDSYPHLSTNLGQGLVTLQMFEEEEEISILKYGAEFFSAFTRNTEIREDCKFKLDYDPLGSLLLIDETNVEQVLNKHEKLKNYGVQNKMLSREELEQRFPWLNFENVLFGSLGMYGEGVIDPWTFIYGLRCKCKSLGVNFVTSEIIDFGYERGDIRRAICKLPDGSYNFIDFAYCVVAGGLESLNIVNLFNQSEDLELAIKLPLEERMRYEYCFYTADGPDINAPIIFNPDGTYLRREGLTGHYVAGVPSVVLNNDSDEDDDEGNPYKVFESAIKPFLIKRMRNLKKIDLVNGWVDAYDFCISNKVGITGPHPSSCRILFALGFSHLGLQYLPGLGRGVMEYLLYDTYQTINFEPFHIENLWRKQHLEADKKRRELLEAQQRVTISE